MSKRLSEMDRRAVDLLLDRNAGRGNGNGNGASHADPALRQHVQAAERVLHMLDVLPAGDPPTDLIQRTRQRIERSMRAPLPEVHSQQLPSRPHA